MNNVLGNTRQLDSWIDGFMAYTEGKPSPRILRYWAAIATVAGALERRCWTFSGRSLLYPNMYILLVAPPGVGKSQAISEVYNFWNTLGTLNIAHSSLTKAALVDQLASKMNSADVPLVGGGSEMYIYHSLCGAISELGVLLPKHDLEFLNTLNDLYDCPEKYSELRRSKGEPLIIDKPHFHMIAGTQPGFMAEILPETAWRMGFTARCIMVYSGEAIKPQLFSGDGLDQELRKILSRDLESIMQLKGTFVWNTEAQLVMNEWYTKKADVTAPTHPRLQTYNVRRHMHVMKLAMIFSAAESSDMIVKDHHVQMAISTLAEAEKVMPQIFLEMVTSPDEAIINEAFNWLVSQYHSNGKKPIMPYQFMHFLASRVPANKIKYIVETMNQSEMIMPSGNGIRPHIHSAV